LADNKIKECIVKIKTNGSHGTGFFIVKNKILTCFHVIKDTLEENIRVIFNGEKYSVKIVDRKEETEIDLAILEVEVDNKNYLDIDERASQEDKFLTYGFADDEDFLTERGAVPITFEYEGNEKHFMKFKNGQFEEGHSGSPIINLTTNSVCGVLNASRNTLNNSGGYGIPIEKLELLGFDIPKKFNTLNPLIDELNQIEHKDIRNLETKLKDSCPEIKEYRVKKYIKQATLGKVEQSIAYDEREISTIKYMIFDECQEELMDFIDKNDKNKKLTFDEVNNFFKNYIDRAKKIIDDKRDEYKYGKFSEDIIKKIILDLIDTCYLSFDEEGIYEEK